MSKLDAALAWAARGFRVFPLAAGTKDQPLFSGWERLASIDPVVIRSWWTDALGMSIADHNVAVLTTGMVVLDVDTRKGGLNSFYALGLEFDTLTVRTPSGGFHLYFTGPDSANGVEGWAAGLDIRSHNGYVLAPGSYVYTTDYEGPYVLELDEALAPVPPVVAQHLRAPRERTTIESEVDLDTPEAEALAIEWLETVAPPAIEGQGGDNTTYQVCCKLRDFGLSEQFAWGLLLEHWNPRCSPPWDGMELFAKVENAYQYATGVAGSEHPLVHFGGVEIPAIETIEPVLPSGEFGNARDPSTIPPRDWRVNRILLRRYVTAVVAPGAGSKSTWALTLAAHKAIGRDFMGFKLKQGKSVIYNAEDDLDEQSRRLAALCVSYNMDFNEVRSKICLLSGFDEPLVLVEGDPPKLNPDAVKRVVSLCSDPEVDMLGLDPLVELHGVDENNNAGMKYVMTVLRLIAARANVALLINHHTGKGKAKAGDADASRGAGAVVNASRVALTLVPADEDDCDRYGIHEDDRYRYVRLDDAKMNLSLQRGKPIWFEKKGVTLCNGDEVGTITVADMAAKEEHARAALVSILHQTIRASGSGSLKIGDAVRAVMAADQLYAMMGMPAVRSRITAALSRGAAVEHDMLMMDFTGQTPTVVLT